MQWERISSIRARTRSALFTRLSRIRSIDCMRPRSHSRARGARVVLSEPGDEQTLGCGECMAHGLVAAGLGEPEPPEHGNRLLVGLLHPGQEPPDRVWLADV